MRKWRAFLAAFLTLSSLLTAQEPDEEARKWAEDALAGMSLRQKVGQVLVGGSSTDYMHRESEDFQEVLEEIRTYHLGGYHAFRGHVLSAAALIRHMQEAAEIPLLISADLEGGVGLIMEGGTRFPKAMALAAAGEEELVRRVGEATAREARAVGVNMNFYPVVDVNNNPENPIISIRSFGEDPQAVGRLAAAYIEGVQSQGVLATAKHFPGHGDTAQDSHLELPVIEAPLERLNEVELPPFKAALDAGVAAVMTAHLAVPALEPEAGLPATLSARILDGLLRREMGFQGLIITDALNMGGIVEHYSDGEAAVQAFLAGADLLLMPRSVKKAYNGLLGAVRTGRIKAERLNASVRRILRAKARAGLHRYRPAELAAIDQTVGSPEHEELAREVMEAAVTVVRDEKNALPLRPGRKGSILLVTMNDEGRFDGRGRAFYQELRDYHRRVLRFEVGRDVTTNEIRLLKELGERVEAVIVAAFIRVAAFKGEISLAPNQEVLLKRLSSLRKPAAFVLFGSPYLLTQVPDLPSYVLAYDDFPGAERATVRVILGRSPARGKLPVSLPELYPLGHSAR